MSDLEILLPEGGSGPGVLVVHPWWGRNATVRDYGRALAELGFVVGLPDAFDGDVVTERHRHRYEANVQYLDKLREAGLVISALTQREQLTEIVELPKEVHPWYIGVQFHPEFKSTPWNGHPLFNAFIKAAMDNHAKGGKKA